MAKLNFGGTEENVVTREEFPLAKAQEVLKNEVDLDDDLLNEVKAKYRRLSQAIGIINNDIVDHTR